MATYSAITTGQRDAESYIDTILAGQWTNNLLAIQEGDGSAPEIHPSSALSDAVTTDGSQTIATTATFTPTQGLYNFVNNASGSTIIAELYVGAAWRGTTSTSYVGGLMFCDGVNMRLYNPSGATATLYYQRFDG